MFENLTAINLALLGLAMFSSGFIDAIAGGGGLIQTPAGLILMPQESVARVIGSLKIPSFAGTFFAAKQYLQKVKIPLNRILLFSVVAFSSSYIGSFCLTKVSNHFMKP
ncbi:MAG: putative rane transporter protein YfcA, partial [Actinomycetota bacterium]